jgi:hypothetical protein
MRRIEPAEMRFVRAVTGYRMADHKCNEGIRQLGITDINTRNDQNVRKKSLNTKYGSCCVDINTRCQGRVTKRWMEQF